LFGLFVLLTLFETVHLAVSQPSEADTTLKGII